MQYVEGRRISSILQAQAQTMDNGRASAGRYTLGTAHYIMKHHLRRSPLFCARSFNCRYFTPSTLLIDARLVIALVGTKGIIVSWFASLQLITKSPIWQVHYTKIAHCKKSVINSLHAKQDNYFPFLQNFASKDESIKIDNIIVTYLQWAELVI